jgi:hypothetical protein
VLNSHFAFRYYIHACVHHSMHVKITQNSDLYTQKVVLTRISVVITFVSVMITLIRLNITLCVYKSLLCVLKSQYVWKLHSAWRNLTMHVEITHYVYKSPFAFRNYTRACVHHSTHENITFVSVIITLIRVNITLIRVNITLVCVDITLCVPKLHSCAWLSHHACEHHTMRVNITLCRVWF